MPGRESPVVKGEIEEQDTLLMDEKMGNWLQTLRICQHRPYEMAEESIFLGMSFVVGQDFVHQ